MSTFQTVQNALTNLARQIVAPRREVFLCGHCDRWKSCGLPPDVACVERERQMQFRREHPETSDRYLPGEFLPYR